jgi:hypothetical protein
MNDYWLEQEKIFKKALEEVEIPNQDLDKVDYVILKKPDDLCNIPDLKKGGGCYWIWTNEPIIHTLHRHTLPKLIDRGEIIYNGIAKDNVKNRIFHHLFGYIDAGWSGISVDIYTKESASHRKKACSPKYKVPYIDNKPIRIKDQLVNLNLSEEEKEYIQNTDFDTYYFRNGINITDDKHENYEFRVYYIIGLESLYLEHIEKKWRESGLPKLCSYISGR